MACGLCCIAAQCSTGSAAEWRSVIPAWQHWTRSLIAASRRSDSNSETTTDERISVCRRPEPKNFLRTFEKYRITFVKMFLAIFVTRWQFLCAYPCNLCQSVSAAKQTFEHPYINNFCVILLTDRSQCKSKFFFKFCNQTMYEVILLSTTGASTSIGDYAQSALHFSRGATFKILRGSRTVIVPPEVFCEAKNAPNLFSAGAPPRTPLRKLCPLISWKGHTPF